MACLFLSSLHYGRFGSTALTDQELSHWKVNTHLQKQEEPMQTMAFLTKSGHAGAQCQHRTVV